MVTLRDHPDELQHLGRGSLIELSQSHEPAPICKRFALLGADRWVCQSILGFTISGCSGAR